MERLHLYSLILLITICHPVATTAANPTATDFIKASCKTTLHPALCIQCLSTYATSIQNSNHHLARAAISVSLTNANSASTYVSKLTRIPRIKPREQQAVQDCIHSMTNSVASLTRSVQELDQMGQANGQDFEWHISNLETWVSSALTNQQICARGFADDSLNGHVKDGVTRRMVYISQVTSNALALVNRFASRHKKGIHMP